MMVATHRADNACQLNDTLNRLDSVKDYRLSPTGE